MPHYVDPQNPDKVVHELIGQPGYNMAKAPPIGRPQIRYQGRYGEFILEADVYPDEALGSYVVHLYCPRCSTPKVPHTLTIRSKNKHVEFDPIENKISIEPFECTWELPEAENRRIAFGAGLCRWRVGIENNVARDA